MQAGRWRPVIPRVASEKSAESGCARRGRERRKVREEGVSEVEALRLRAREARGGEGQPGLGSGRDSSAGAPRHT